MKAHISLTLFNQTIKPKQSWVYLLYVILFISSQTYAAPLCSNFLHPTKKTAQSLKRFGELNIRTKNTTVFIKDFTTNKLVTSKRLNFEHTGLAAAMVYEQSFHRKRDIVIEVHDYFLLGDKKLHNSGLFDMDNGRIKISIEGVKDSPLGFTDQLIFTAAHEATHLVQRERGETLIDSLTDENYDTNPHEKEADTVALDVLRLFSPYQKVSIERDDGTIFTPAISSFAHWHWALRGLNREDYQRYLKRQKRNNQSSTSP